VLIGVCRVRLTGGRTGGGCPALAASNAISVFLTFRHDPEQARAHDASLRRAIGQTRPGALSSPVQPVQLRTDLAKRPFLPFQVLDHVQPAEDGFVIEPVPPGRPARLGNQAHGGVVVNRLARYAGILHDLADAVGLGRDTPARRAAGRGRSLPALLSQSR